MLVQWALHGTHGLQPSQKIDCLSICGFESPRFCTIQSNREGEAMDQVYFRPVGNVTIPPNFAQLGHCSFAIPICLRISGSLFFPNILTKAWQYGHQVILFDFIAINNHIFYV